MATGAALQKNAGNLARVSQFRGNHIVRAVRRHQQQRNNERDENGRRAHESEPMISSEIEDFLLFNLRCVLSMGLIAACSRCAKPPSPPTFTKDVMPILQQQCQTCHRPGEAGPFSMLTYETRGPGRLP